MWSEMNELKIGRVKDFLIGYQQRRLPGRTMVGEYRTLMAGRSAEKSKFSEKNQPKRHYNTHKRYSVQGEGRTAVTNSLSAVYGSVCVFFADSEACKISVMTL